MIERTLWALREKLGRWDDGNGVLVLIHHFASIYVEEAKELMHKHEAAFRDDFQCTFPGWARKGVRNPFRSEKGS